MSKQDIDRALVSLVRKGLIKVYMDENGVERYRVNRAHRQVKEAIE